MPPWSWRAWKLVSASPSGHAPVQRPQRPFHSAHTIQKVNFSSSNQHVEHALCSQMWNLMGKLPGARALEQT